jgi:5-methylcytosine-specific restriction endonuclease McrA
MLMAYRGKTPKELGTARWKNARRYIRARDGDRCRVCDASGVVQRMFTHHILPRAQGGTDDVKNLMLVCQSCHMKLEREAQQLAAKPKRMYPNSEWIRPGLDGGWQPVSRDWGGSVIRNPEWPPAA